MTEDTHHSIKGWRILRTGELRQAGDMVSTPFGYEPIEARLIGFAILSDDRTVVRRRLRRMSVKVSS